MGFAGTVHYQRDHQHRGHCGARSRSPPRPPPAPPHRRPGCPGRHSWSTHRVGKWRLSRRPVPGRCGRRETLLPGRCRRPEGAVPGRGWRTRRRCACGIRRRTRRRLPRRRRVLRPVGSAQIQCLIALVGSLITTHRSAHAAKFIDLFLQHTTENYRPSHPHQLARSITTAWAHHQ